MDGRSRSILDKGLRVETVKNPVPEPDDQCRNDILRRMLKAPPTPNEQGKLGKPRNPQQKSKPKPKQQQA
jgi:hypothetical protein